MITSFNYSAIVDARKMAKKRGISSNIQTMYLKSSQSSGSCKTVASNLNKAGINSISLKYTCVTKTLIKTFHKYGIKVGIWTVPNHTTAVKYAKMGVDYITADGKVY